MLVLSGPVVDAIGTAIGIGETGSDHLEHRQVAGRPRAPGADDRRPLLLDARTCELRGFKWVSPGAAVAIVVAIVASALFAFYVGNFGSYNKTYGALAGVVVFLIWFWLINLALLFGIELDAEIERTRELKEGVPRAEKEIQLDAREDPKDQADDLTAVGRRARLPPGSRARCASVGRRPAHRPHLGRAARTAWRPPSRPRR